MGVNSSVPLPNYITTLITIKAKQLVGKHRFTKSDQDDLEQQITLEVVRRRAKFDPGRAQQNTFLARLVAHAVADIVAARKAASRDYRREDGTLDCWVKDDEAQWVRRVETVTEDAADLRTGRGGLSAEDLGDLKVDMPDAAAALPERLREILELIKTHGSAQLAAEAAGVHRSTVYDLIEQIGVYSAGLRSRDTEHPIIVAGIQSVYHRAAELDRFDLVLIDESHMIPLDGDGMYQTFLADAKVINPNVRLIGLTATPYRMTTGRICGPDNLLNHVCFEVGVRELIVQGYLCPLKTKAGKQKVDTSGLHIRGGEFIADEVEQLMDDDGLVMSACREIVEHAQDRHSTLVFAAGVQHALHVQRVLAGMGQECGFVCGDTLPFERAATLKRFKDGELKYLVNINVLTTGFDAPNIDCVAMLRPTNSPGLYYQMVGRGFRLCPGKADCLVLDFGGNVLRHGPVDAIRISEKECGNGAAPAKECPQCQALIHAAYTICPECGFEFPPPDRRTHDREASTTSILSGEVEDIEYEVQAVGYHVHVKRGADESAPKTMRVDYQIGLADWKSEWVCVEHDGYARQKAGAWWTQRSAEPVPSNSADAVHMANEGYLADTLAITVRHVAGEKFDKIIRYRLGPKQGGMPWPGSEPVLADCDVPF